MPPVLFSFSSCFFLFHTIRVFPFFIQHCNNILVRQYLLNWYVPHICSKPIAISTFLCRSMLMFAIKLSIVKFPFIFMSLLYFCPSIYRLIVSFVAACASCYFPIDLFSPSFTIPSQPFCSLFLYVFSFFPFYSFMIFFLSSSFFYYVHYYSVVSIICSMISLSWCGWALLHCIVVSRIVFSPSFFIS